MTTLVRLPEAPPRGGRVPRHAAPSRGKGIAVHVGGLALIALLVPLHRFWAAQLLLVLLLLVVPGLVLLRALRVPGRVLSLFPVYVPCASLVVLLGSGLAADVIGPLLGAGSPLRAAPLLVSMEVACLALLGASVNAPPGVALPRMQVPRPAGLAWPLILPLAAAAGALRLNSGQGAGVAVIALAACVVVAMTAAALSARLASALLAGILYATGLALLWSYSLRGNGVYGFDISAEYFGLKQTVSTGIWHASQAGNAYRSMLSVTVMPAALHALSGVPDLLVLKVVYPAIAALLPVAVFYLARGIVSRRWAFAAALLVVIQPTFAQELPAIARQEIAIVLFAGLVAATLDTRIPRRSQYALVVLLGFAMVISHYATVYVAIIAIGLTLPLQWVLSWFRQMPRITGAVAVAFIAIAGGAVIWYGPVTHSQAHLFQVAQTVDARGLDVLPNKSFGMSALAAYFEGNSVTPMPATEYSRLISNSLPSINAYITPLRNASRYPLRDSAAPIPAIRWKSADGALNLGALIVQQLVYLLGVVGALVMVLLRRSSRVVRQVGLLTVGALLFLVLIRLSGTLADAYNQGRALLQALAILAIAACWALQRLAGWRQRQQAGVLAAAIVALAVLFISTSGLQGSLLGGGTATNLANSGEDFERFYVTAPELASAQWLGQFTRRGQFVYADRYAQLPLIAMTGISRDLFNGVTPATLNSRDTWIYAGTSNIVAGRARALYNDHSVTYVFPATFLHANYDTVYTNGSSEVFYR
jgi:uncharacterized membrane protein